MLENFSWVHQRNNFVVKKLDSEIDRLRKQKKATGASDWKEREICSFDEKLLSTFVDIDGEPTSRVVQRTDDAGRQSVSFFLRTLSSILMKTTIADFSTSDSAVVDTPEYMEEENEAG